ncbi:MAG: PilW family protein [Burkholderiales bacterium]|jgi:type IV pilus assembly protein PilW|nr:PilW family protein [Burkholderiales bacterium]
MKIMNGSMKKQKGATIVELMIAVLIGTLAMYAVYRVYEGTERAKRTIATVGDAQMSGLYSTFLLEESIQNAGFALMFNKTSLMKCPNNPIGAPATPSDTSVALSLKPLPVVIDRSPDTARSDFANFDDIYVFAGRSSRYVMPLTVDGANANTPFGFIKDTVLVDTQTSACNLYLVTADIAAEPSGAPVSTPVSANIHGAGGATPVSGAKLISLGVPSRLRYYVDEHNTLQVEVWNLDTSSTNPNPTGQWIRTRTDPIISGVMLLRAQYGIDTTVTETNPGSGVTAWVDADVPWDMSTLQGLTNPVTVDQIKAIRLALIVRTDEPENSATFNQATDFNVFQSCPTAGGCGEAIKVSFPAGTGKGGTTYRYRMYEKVIPLRNTLYNLPTT